MYFDAVATNRSKGASLGKQVSLNLPVAEAGGRQAGHAESVVAPLRNSARPMAFIGPFKSS